jgi:hypothetical protein
MVNRAMSMRPRAIATAAVLGSAALLAACSSGSSTSSPTSGPLTTEAPPPNSVATSVVTLPPTVPPAGGAAPTAPAGSAAAPPSVATSVGTNADSSSFDQSAFGDSPARGSNQWFPLTPGYQSVREGGVNKGSRRLPHRRVYTVTNMSKVIDGVKTVMVLDQDFDGGELAEQAIDYLAEDTQGNVWYLGSYTEAYEGGQFVQANDAWLAGVNGGKAGILMMTDPTTDTPKYAQATVPGEGTAKAQVTKTGQSICVPFNCYKGVLVIEEDGSELTYYASGVGGIKLEPESGNPQETEQLINLTQLSTEGLNELSAEAKMLDDHAHTEAKGVFGSSAAAQPL